MALAPLLASRMSVVVKLGLKCASVRAAVRGLPRGYASSARTMAGNSPLRLIYPVLLQADSEGRGIFLCYLTKGLRKAVDAEETPCL